MDVYRTFVKETGLLGLLQIISLGKGIVLLPFLTKLLGPENYGVWTQVTITVSLFLPFILLGLHRSLVRFLGETEDMHERREHVWSLVVFVGGTACAISIVLLALMAPIASFLQVPAWAVAIVAILVITRSLNQLLLAGLQAMHRIKTYAALALSSELLEIALTATLLLLGYGITGALLAPLLVQCISLALLFGLFIIIIGIHWPRFSLLKTHLHFGLPTVAANSAYWVVQVSDRYLIGFFWGILFVGYYAPAYAFGNLLNVFIVPPGTMLSATLPKLFAKNDFISIKKYLSYSLKYLLAILMPAAFGLTALSYQFLTITTTEEIAAHAYPIIPLVAFSFVLYGVRGIFTQVLALYKETRVRAAAWTLAALINLALNILLIPILGIWGAALTTLIAFSSATAIEITRANRLLTIPVNWADIGKILAASLFMAGSIWMASPQGMLQVALAIPLAAALYAILLFATKTITKKELSFFLSLLKK